MPSGFCFPFWDSATTVRTSLSWPAVQREGAQRKGNILAQATQDQPAPADPSAGSGCEPEPTQISLALPGPEPPSRPTAFRATVTANCFKSLILGGWLSSSSYLTQGLDHIALLIGV